MEYTLTLREKISARSGQPYGGGTPFMYDVEGMPPGERARIVRKPYHENWGVQRNYGERYGDYETAEQARAALESEVNSAES